MEMILPHKLTDWLIAIVACACLAMLAGCDMAEQTVAVPRSSFDRMLGAQPTDTNLLALIAALESRLQNEVLANSNNWRIIGGLVQQFDARFKALEPQPVAPANLLSQPKPTNASPIEAPKQ